MQQVAGRVTSGETVRADELSAHFWLVVGAAAGVVFPWAIIAILLYHLLSVLLFLPATRRSPLPLAGDVFDFSRSQVSAVVVVFESTKILQHDDWQQQQQQQNQKHQTRHQRRRQRLLSRPELSICRYLLPTRLRVLTLSLSLTHSQFGRLRNQVASE